MEQTCGVNTEIGFRQVESGVPATIRGVGQDGLCVVVSGVTSISQGNSIRNSYERLLVNSSTNFYGEWFWEGAVQLVNRLRLADHAVNRDVFVFGHSGGGGIAIALASILRRLNPRHDVHCVTFGEPRCGLEQTFSGLAGVNVTRWMNFGDDVPQLPPRMIDLTDLSFLALLDKLPFWARFVHVFGGLVLDRLGSVTPGDVPPPWHQLSILNFPVNYLSRDTVFGSDHSIAEYVRRLSLSLPPKIPGVLPKLKGMFDVGSLPIMFQVLTSDIPMSLPIPIQGGVERSIPETALALNISRREAFINEPLKRC